MDKVIERVENRYWKIEISEFQFWILGFYKWVGEWKTTELEANKIQIDYTYALYSNSFFWQPFNWLVVKIFWTLYMKQVLENIRMMILNDEPYGYE